MENMKRILAILAVVAMLFALSGVAEEGALALDQTSVTMDYSQTVTLTAANGGESARWSSSDENVARLSVNRGESVEVVGIHAGTATITCTAGEQQQSCEVTVKAPETLQITGVDYPSTLNVERSMWLLRLGTVASVDDLSTLTSEIKDANGELIGSSYTQTFSEGVKRYDIKGIDDYVPFSQISAEGQYKWTLSATDVKGRAVSIDLPINAIASEDTAVSSNPGAYSQGMVAPEESTADEGGEANAPSADAANEAETTGRNRILDGAFEKNQEYWDEWGGPTTREFVEQDGKTWCHIVSTPNAQFQGVQQNPYNAHGITVTGYDQYTFSARVKAAAENQKFTVGIHWRDDSGILGQNWNTWTIGTEEQILTFTVTGFPGCNSFNLMVGVNDADSEQVHDIYFTDIKLEFGNTATPWAPAPEDVIEGDGRNRVLNSAFERAQENWSNWGEPTTREFVEQDGKTWCHIVSTPNARFQGVQQNAYASSNITVAAYNPYTFSARVKAAAKNTKFTMGIHWMNDTGILSQTWNTWTIGTEEQLITYTATASSGSRFINLMLGVNDADSTAVHDIYFTDVKFELGDTATDWSPAPEDEGEMG